MGRDHRSTLHTILLGSALQCATLALGAGSAAALPDVEDIDLIALHERDSGVPASQPYRFEACVRGTSIDTVDMTTPLAQPGPPDHSLVMVGTEEWCLSQSFATAGDLATAFPLGDYSFEIGGPTGGDSITLGFQLQEPEAFPTISAPADGVPVPPSTDLLVSWTLTEKSPCLATNSCGDAIALRVVDIAADDTVHDDILTLADPSATIPGSVLLPDLQFRADVIVFFGGSGSDATDMGDPLNTTIAFGDLDRVQVGTPSMPMDIGKIDLIRGLDRWDGTPIVDPFFFEACVEGTSIDSAAVITPSAQPGPADLALVEGEVGRFCGLQRFATVNDLLATYPGGLYTVEIDGTGFADTRSFTFQETEPLAYFDFSAPLDGDATIDSSVDLPATWVVVEKQPCLATMSCGNLAFFMVEDSATGENALDEQIALADGGRATPASELGPGATYDLELLAAQGSMSAGTTDLGDPIDFILGFADFNRISVSTIPEPDAGLVGFAAVLALSRLRRCFGR